MKTIIATLVVLLCFSAVAAAEFSYPIISSGPDDVTFSFGCKNNNDCMAPGKEYCGNSYVKTTKCISGNLCEVGCSPFTTQKATLEAPTGTYSITPVDRRTGAPVTITLKDTSGKPLLWDVEVYYGGVWDNPYDARKSITSEVPQGTEFLATLKTDRWGRASFTPDKPGRYFFKTIGKLIRFNVADESGNIFDCGNGVCEDALGEDIYVCGDDCEESVTAPITPPPSQCGNGVCNGTETYQSCLQDCQPPQAAAPVQVQQPQGDNGMMIIAIVAACAAAGIAAFFYMKKFKKPAGAKKEEPKAEKGAKPKPNKCPKCSANVPAGDTFCSVCGERIIPPD